MQSSSGKRISENIHDVVFGSEGDPMHSQKRDNGVQMSDSAQIQEH